MKTEPELRRSQNHSFIRQRLIFALLLVPFSHVLPWPQKAGQLARLTSQCERHVICYPSSEPDGGRNHWP
jgi:hypothetical protein